MSEVKIFQQPEFLFMNNFTVKKCRPTQNPLPTPTPTSAMTTTARAQLEWPTQGPSVARAAKQEA